MVYGLRETESHFIGNKYFNGKKYFVEFDTTSKEVIEKYKKELQKQNYYTRVIKYSYQGKIRYTLYRRKK
jgi:hypothetical protein